MVPQIDYLSEDRDLSLLEGISYKSNEQWQHNKGCRFVENLDSLPWPAHDLMEINKYQYHTLITGRGCEFNCSFCTTRKVSGKGQRLRSINDVVNEMEFLYRVYGQKPFSFYDENFFFSKSRLIGLCNEILSQPVKFNWRVFQGGRVDKVDRELLVLMKKSGCFSIGFGLESADEDVLKKMNKKITVDDIKRASKMMKEANIRASFFVTIGNHGDTTKSIDKTIRLIKDIVPNYVIVNMVVPYPNTPLKNWVDKDENVITLRKECVDTFYTNDTFKVPQPAFETEDLSVEERIKMFCKAAAVAIGLSELKTFIKRSLKYFMENRRYRLDIIRQLYYFFYFNLKRLLSS